MSFEARFARTSTSGDYLAEASASSLISIEVKP